MARNVEIKARIGDMAATRRHIAEAADGEPEMLSQTDTYFHVRTGRLKLREFADREAELIYYLRPDEGGPTASNYHRIPIAEPHALRELLADALGIRGEVIKRRRVYWVGRTRVHLDEVQDLGEFLELEVVLGDDESTKAGGGFGLTKAYFVAKQFGGRMWIESEVNQGTTITIHLPSQAATA